jgi:hypothetical protein
VGDLCGKRPAVAPAASSWWRKTPKAGPAAPDMKGFCCGSGCAGCPYMVNRA